MGLIKRWVATREGFKPREVEELVDYYWHRPLAGLFVQLIQDGPITPNQVTISSGFVSALSGTAIGLGGYYGAWWASVGAVLLLISIVLDCADGQLARIKGISSVLGRALDGTMDIVAPVAVFHGMAFYLLGSGFSAWLIWPIAGAAGLSLLWHAQQYDLGKNIYLHASRPDFSLGGDTLLTPENMREMKVELQERGETLSFWVIRLFLGWTETQAPQLRPWLQADHTANSDAERALFRELFRPLMRMLTWLGFGTHLFVLTIGALLAPFDVRAIWVAFAIMVGPLNVMAIGYALVRPRREREFVRRLAAHREGAR